MELATSERATVRERAELGAIARSCVDRVDRELGNPDGWFVHIGMVDDRFVCTVVVHDRGCAIETTCDRSDAGIAIRNAVRVVEQVLRDVRASRRKRISQS
jgi:hypothetical protein